jgi:hypothetical protein
MPVLMGDASVRMYAYSYADPNSANICGNASVLSSNAATFAALFAWNRGVSINAP